MQFGLRYALHNPSPLSLFGLGNSRTFNQLEDSMKRKSLPFRVLLVSMSILVLVGIVSLNAFGQAGTSTIRGTVTDPQGNVVPGATVTLTNVGTTTSRTTTTSDLGAYAFEFVPVGDYKV